MPTLIPEFSEEYIATFRSRGEASFYRACHAQLRSRYLVLHSVPWIYARSGQRPQEGESDFAIFDPRGGFVVVEVKGGGIKFDAAKAEWTSVSADSQRHKIRDPFAQATDEKYAILTQLKNDHDWSKTGCKFLLAAHAVFMPDLRDIAPLIGPNRPREIIGARGDLSDIQQWLDGVVEYWEGTGARFDALGSYGIDLVRRLFVRSFEILPRLAERLQDEEAVHIQLTQQQGEVLRALCRRRTAAICGGAGTGKTLLAVERAIELAESGRRVILLCYNRCLANHLKEVTPAINIHAFSFHELCHHRIKEALALGRNLRQEAERAYPGEDFFNIQLPYALALSAEVLDYPYDVTIIDEGQDFQDEYWLALDMLLKTREYPWLFVFFDQNQTVYKLPSLFPIEDEPFVLTRNCRNTEHIHRAAYRYFSGDTTQPPKLEGMPIKSLSAIGIPLQAKAIAGCVRSLLMTEKVLARDIVVLIAGQPQNNFIEALVSIGLGGEFKWHVKDAPGISKTSILVETVRRFKGLEAPIIILWGLDALDFDIDRELLYVGLSRARSVLFVVGNIETCKSLIEKDTNVKLVQD